MLGTNVWSVVSVIGWRLFVDGLLFGAHVQERLSPARGAQNWQHEQATEWFIQLCTLYRRNL
jgi:hypothetical protein